jgi:hypothetical protein
MVRSVFRGLRVDLEAGLKPRLLLSHNLVVYDRILLVDGAVSLVEGRGGLVAVSHQGHVSAASCSAHARDALQAAFALVT